ncbi:hypothetical protein BGZ58_002764 [Dissophora ornata]|nr:hypothetical protein BGZ58_002764 [Dissophora ornata]
MDYEDDAYDEHQQYEDELYKDPSGESEFSDGVDSEVEDTILSHIHYSTNVYKKAGVNSAKLAEGQEANTTSNSATGTSSAVATPPKGHLAATPTATEDYFKAVNQGNELDSENEEGIIKASKRVKLSTTTGGAGGKSNNDLKDDDHSEQDEEEESRYSVEKKKDIGLNSWSQRVGASEDPTMDMSDADESDEEVIESADQSHNESEESHNESEESHNESDGLDEHFLDLGGSKQGEEKELNNYDLDAELGHLEGEDFKITTEYYERYERVVHDMVLGEAATISNVNVCNSATSAASLGIKLANVQQLLTVRQYGDNMYSVQTSHCSSLFSTVITVPPWVILETTAIDRDQPPATAINAAVIVTDTRTILGMEIGNMPGKGNEKEKGSESDREIGIVNANERGTGTVSGTEIEIEIEG